MDNCDVCKSKEKCTECSNGYFLTVEGKCKPKSEIHNCKVEIDKTNGCTECSEGYYVKDKECYGNQILHKNERYENREERIWK